MTRNVLVVVGAALLSIGGIGIIVGLVWVTASRVQGTLPDIFDARAETLLYLLPALLLTIAIIGACFVAGALAVPTKSERNTRTLRHTRIHL
jgi:multisubunit Na+/H+ antiporter MnhC subunit